MDDDINIVAPAPRYSREVTRTMTRDYIAHRLAISRRYRWPTAEVAAAAERGEEHLAQEGEEVAEPSEEDRGAAGGEAPLDIPIPPTVACGVLRRLAEEFEKMYREVFVEMCSQLEVTADSAYPAFLGVSQELFSDGIQWGRIVALFAFSGSLAVRVLDDGMPHLIDSIADWLAMYIDENLSAWIIDNGNWEAFVEFYGADGNRNRRPEVPWPTMRNFFCGAAAGAIGVLTIGAILSTKW